jgi:hypothetical protein
MSRSKRKANGLIGTLRAEEGVIGLRLYSIESRCLIATVIGSAPYVKRALRAVGLLQTAAQPGGAS